MIKGISTAACAAAMCLGSGAALADQNGGDNAFADIGGRLYISPLYSYTLANTRRHTGDGHGYALTIGKEVNDYVNLELYGYHNQFHGKAEDPGHMHLNAYGLGIMGFPLGPRDDSLGRWLGGAYGLVRMAYGNGKSDIATQPNASGTRFVLDAGLGYLARIPYFNYAKLRVEAHYRIDYGGAPFAAVVNDGGNGKAGFDDIVFSAGLLIPIGAAPTGHDNTDVPPPP